MKTSMRSFVFGILVSGMSLIIANVVQAEEYRAYVGTYTRGDSRGVYTFTIDSESGQATEPVLAAELVNPSFVAFDPSSKYLFAVNEVSDFPGSSGKGAGGVSGFKIDPDTGLLTKINSQVSGGAGPCHLSVDKTGKAVVVANYGGGSVALLPIGEGGQLQPATSFIQHAGKSVNPRRQEGPHAHSANIDAGNRFVAVCDLGLDQVLVYKIDAAAGRLTPNAPAFCSVHPGAGPRHFSFHPNGKFAYANGEMELSVTAFSYDAEKGVLSQLGTWSTVPAGVSGDIHSTAECLCHPSGKFVYVSNRGHNSIAVFQVQEDGTLKPQGQVATQGKIPRNFGITPDGKLLLAANQDSGTIFIYKVDLQTGALTPTGDSLNVPTPVCVRFIRK